MTLITASVPLLLVVALGAICLTVPAYALPASAHLASTPTVGMSKSNTPAGERVPSPRVIGPVSGTPSGARSGPLGQDGYVQQEYFLRGTATRYLEAGTWDSSGRWSVRPAGQAPYETRILVRRPANPARFNGTVIVEWLDSPSGTDGDQEFLYERTELLRAGFAWVGVSTAVDYAADSVSALRAADPQRYASLSFPGISYSYSIFSQAAQSLLHTNGADPLGGLRARALIADGDSGGAHMLLTYSNAIQPADRLFGGFLLHSRAKGAADISHSGTRSPGSIGPQPPDQPAPPLVFTRNDLTVPVLTVESEFDLLTPVDSTLDYFPVTQPDSGEFRLWELAGTPHADVSIVEALRGKPAPVQCALRPNDGDQQRDVMDSALGQLNRWIRTGIPAMHSPRIDIRGGADPSFLRDKYGNARGGVRTPDLQVPVATLTGGGNTSPDGTVPPGGYLADTCLFVGTSTQFSTARLTTLYPTHAAYVAAVSRAAMRDVTIGVLSPPDAERIVRASQQAPIP